MPPSARSDEIAGHDITRLARPWIAVRRTDAATFAQVIIDNFDEMQAKARLLVMGIAPDAYVVGQPYCLRHLRRALQHIVQHRGEMRLTTAGAVAIGRYGAEELSGLVARKAGGEGGIRTHDTLAGMPHFECGAIDHSATSPARGRARAGT